MTLCAAWLRQGKHDEGQELVFATDSRLRGGEAWDSGIKLFDLGRSDCLLCFAGATQRAYPLVLHASNAIRSHIEWSNPRFDLLDVLDLLCQMFTQLCDSITELPQGITKEDAMAEAVFLFGGWSWRTTKLRAWRIFYSPLLHAFTHEEAFATSHFIFIGDKIDVAESLLADTIYESKRALASSFDMEPFRVVAQMARETQEYNMIGGALQVGKVYRSGHNEFLGVMWPSTTNGKPCLHGRELNPFDAPPIRFLDPDSAAFVDALPATLGSLDTNIFGADARFVKECYADDHLNADLGEARRDRLKRIFQTQAYHDFVAEREKEAKANDATTAASNEANKEQTV